VQQVSSAATSCVSSPTLVASADSRFAVSGQPISFNMLTGALNTLQAVLIARTCDLICYRHSVIARRRRYTLTGSGWGTYRFAERK
jgi:hypothetical protein